MKIAFDFETYRIGPGAICPKPVCLTWASRDVSLAPDGAVVVNRGGVEVGIIGNADKDAPTNVVRGLLEATDLHLYGANLAFDLGVAAYHDPSLVPLIFAAGHAGRLHDVMIIEKLKRLSTTGNLEFVTLPDGSNKELRYDLSSLEKRHIGRDRSAQKEGEETWRANYSALDGRLAADYPADAMDYAMADAEGTLLVAEAQEITTTESGHRSANTEAIQAFADFCFMLITAQGMGVDAEQVKRLDDAVDEVMSPEHHAPLYDAGLLDPAVPERIRRTKKGAVMRHKTGPYAGQPILVKGKEEKVNKRAIQQHVLDLCMALDRKPKITATGIENKVPLYVMEKGDDDPLPQQRINPDVVKYISTDRATLVDLDGLDPTGLLSVYATRQRYAKVKSTYLPVLRNTDRVWAGYNVIVSTGRSSSRGGGKKPLYPSCNIQNIPRLMEGNLNVRACFVPDPGYTFCSIDFSALELCSFAQTCYELLGYSVLRDAINAGYDPHAFLGAQLAAALDPEFGKALDDEGITDKHDRYKAFMRLKGTDIGGKLFKKYRTFAKPVGLGFPGGLGIQTFRVFAKSVYGVVIESDELAKTLKDLWFDTYPEAKEYLAWVPSQEDAERASDENGGLCYTSPLGMFRANANYCATANGRGLQTPSAEGFKLAVIDCVERCVNPDMGDEILFGTMAVAQVHDEILFMFPQGRERECGEHAARVMCENMSVIMPDMVVRAEPAYMTRWLKGAEGRDLIWSMNEEGELSSEPLDNVAF
jgi:hypothetical protein